MKHSNPPKKILRKIRKMKKNEEITVSLNDEVLNIICINDREYLIFTPDSFYETNYNEIKEKYQ